MKEDPNQFCLFQLLLLISVNFTSGVNLQSGERNTFFDRGNAGNWYLLCASL